MFKRLDGEKIEPLAQVDEREIAYCLFRLRPSATSATGSILLQAVVSHPRRGSARLRPLDHASPPRQSREVVVRP